MRVVGVDASLVTNDGECVYQTGHKFPLRVGDWFPYYRTASDPDLLQRHTLSPTCVINIFSQPGTCSFIFLAVSFNAKKCSLLIRPTLSILCFDGLWYVRNPSPAPLWQVFFLLKVLYFELVPLGLGSLAR